MFNFILRCIAVICIVCCVSDGYIMTENQIKEDIKFLSQTADGVKPSRLRAMLLADLRRALPTVSCVLSEMLIYLKLSIVYGLAMFK